ncbi:MAG: hypothetical protein GX624_07345 [Actinobacteria bacterium]|nr:hypothetical protein [Actinomycetota bacterium]
MVAAYYTPASALLLLAALVAFMVLTGLSRGRGEEAAAAGGRRLKSAFRGFRLRKPTRRQVHTAWVVGSAAVAFALTRGIAVPVFVLIFFALWLTGFGAIQRYYR